MSGGFSEITVNPVSGRRLRTALVERARALGGIPDVAALSCPSRSACTAVDSGQREVTFNPRHPKAPRPVKIAHGRAILSAVSCSAATLHRDRCSWRRDHVRPASPMIANEELSLRFARNERGCL